MSKARDIADLDFNSPDIDGGNIDGATIGGTTPAAGTFTGVNVDGNGSNLTLDNGSNPATFSNLNGNVTINFDTTGAGRNYTIQTNSNNAFRIGSGGDISIYDSSSNAKIFWDASASRLGINNTSPNSFSIGDLVIGNGSSTPGVTLYSSNTTEGIIRFADGTSGNEQYRGQIKYNHAEDSLNFHASAASSSTENLILKASEAVFNEGGINTDFRVESDSNAHGLFLRGSDGAVGISTSPHAWETGVGGRQPIQVGFGSISGRLNDLHTEFTNNAYAVGTGNSPQWAGMTRWPKNQVALGSGGQILFNTSPTQSEADFNNSPNFNWTNMLTLSSAGAVFNEDSTADQDFRVESTGDTHMFFVDGGTNEIGVGTSNPENRMEIRTNDGNTGHTSGLTLTNFSLTSNARAGISFRNYDNYGAAIYSPRTGSTQGKLVLGVNAGYNTTQASVQPKLVILHGGGTEQYSSVNDARWFAANSAFSNPTVDLFTGSTNGGNYPQTCFEVTLYGNGVSANEHQVFRGGGTFDYTSVSNGTAQNLTTYTNYHVGNALPAVPFFALSGNTLQMTCNRQTNYDTYRIEVRVWGRNTTQAWGTHQ